MSEDHTIAAGEDVLSLAHPRGLLWKSVWNHPSNAALKSLREDPNILLPGDILHLPDLQKKQEAGATENRHRFQTPTTKVKLDLKLIRARREAGQRLDQEASEPWEYREVAPAQRQSEPIANAPYVILADGLEVARGTTGADGRIQETIPVKAVSGTLILHQGSDQEQRYDLHWRHLDPLKEISGVCQRLFNLGIPCPPETTTLTSAVATALRIFQRQHQLSVTGQADDATRAKLKEVHGC